MFAPLFLWLQFCLLLCVAAETAEVNSVEVLRVKRDMNDVDMTDSSSDTSSTGGQEQDLDSGDPNLHNPQPNEGYGHEYQNRRYQAEQDELMGTRRPTSQIPTGGSEGASGGRPTTTKAPPIPWSEQTYYAVLQFGIIVGVAIMVGSMFMAMVGAELLYDHVCDKIREIFKQQKPAPDIERLHPAELVGTFSRYK